jgi:hypothetical protein
MNSLLFEEAGITGHHQMTTITSKNIATIQKINCKLAAKNEKIPSFRCLVNNIHSKAH